MIVIGLIVVILGMELHTEQEFASGIMDSLNIAVLAHGLSHKSGRKILHVLVMEGVHSDRQQITPLNSNLSSCSICGGRCSTSVLDFTYGERRGLRVLVDYCIGEKLTVQSCAHVDSQGEQSEGNENIVLFRAAVGTEIGVFAFDFYNCVILGFHF